MTGSETRRSVRELRALIDAPRAGSVLPELVVALNRHLGAMGAAYRPCLETEGWAVESMCHSGEATMARLGQGTVRFLKDAPLSFAHFDALSVQPEQQNTLVDQHMYRRTLATRVPVMAAVHEPLGLTRLPHMRVTVTDGPFLLSWVGVFREAPFSAGDEEIFRAIIAPLQRRLLAERALWSGAPSGSLAEVLDLVTAPALVFTPDLRLVHANAAGRAWLDRDRALLREAADAVAGRPPSARIGPRIAITSLGHATHHVVLLRDSAVPRRLADVVEAHRLTRAEADVLVRVVAGDANKDIAARLKCAPRTVESHVGALLSKCQVESRARLIAWFWTRS